MEPYNQSSIEYFKDTYLKEFGLARPTRYKVEITSPTGQKVNFQPETMTLPNRSFKQLNDDTYGPTRKIPIARDFAGTIILTFPMSEDQSERAF